MSISLVSSPKILGQMVHDDHLCVSFKLETDATILYEKIDMALRLYKIDLVVGNLLGKKSWVFIKPN